ncbi:hypothetical protein [Sorangium sp. So ce394]|uniref:hypothetical protein n=1 Tax=Sorangium sp. So ce394 TaxID=3133310 RepID=UPI003F5B0F2D
MSRYRSDIEVVRLRIHELEERLRRVRAQQIRAEAAANLGPEAARPFSRGMYHLGRALRRLLRGRGPAPAQELAAARARLAWLERRVAMAEVELSRAEAERTRTEAERSRASLGADRWEPASGAHPGSMPAVDLAPAVPQSAPSGRLAYRLGRAIGRLSRR